MKNIAKKKLKTAENDSKPKSKPKAKDKPKLKPEPKSKKQGMLDIDKLKSTKLITDPYEYLVVTDFIQKDYVDKSLADYPTIKSPGSIPLQLLKYGANFSALIDEMNGDAFRKAVEEKFSVNLEGKPTIFTARGKCRLRDGKIHTDTESKIITVLLYMNPAWFDQGGNLKILRSDNLGDVAAEIPPLVGTLLVFKRSDKSFHGHLPFKGKRQVIQMNWVTHQSFVDHEVKRHKRSFIMKALNPFSY